MKKYLLTVLFALFSVALLQAQSFAFTSNHFKSSVDGAQVVNEYVNGYIMLDSEMVIIAMETSSTPFMFDVLDTYMDSSDDHIHYVISYDEDGEEKEQVIYVLSSNTIYLFDNATGLKIELSGLMADED